MLQAGQRGAVFVAIEAEDDADRAVTYYAQLLLGFVGTYLGKPQELCYVRWLHTASAVAAQEGRALTPAETRGPFECYRWAIYPRARAGHPAAGSAWYGVVHVSAVMWRVHMVASMHDEALFRLNTDVWLANL